MEEEELCSALLPLTRSELNFAVEARSRNLDLVSFTGSGSADAVPSPEFELDTPVPFQTRASQCRSCGGLGGTNESARADPPRPTRYRLTASLVEINTGGSNARPNPGRLFNDPGSGLRGGRAGGRAGGRTGGGCVGGVRGRAGKRAGGGPPARPRNRPPTEISRR